MTDVHGSFLEAAAAAREQQPALDLGDVKVWLGDCIDSLRAMPAGIAQTVTRGRGDGTSGTASAGSTARALPSARRTPRPAARDGRSAADESGRNPSTDGRPAPALLAELASTPPRTPASRSSATPRSSGTRRTGLAPSTTPPCTPSGGTLGRTACTSTSRDSAAPRASTPASSRGSAGSPADAPSADTPTRTERTYSCGNDSTSLGSHTYKPSLEPSLFDDPEEAA